MSGKIAIEEICARREQLRTLALNIWNNPEPPFQERQAAQWTADILKEAGFDVQLGAAGLPTAIVASYGQGKPVIGFLGEYDPLPGMSQQANCPEKKPVTPGAYGHGCGHNLLGTANVGAVLGAKKEMEARGLSGTLVFYGCPAEELASGKGIMAQAGLFDGLDACLVFHPDVRNVVQRGSNASCLSMKIRYHGRSAHAGGSPQDGRSALKGVELCGIGVQYLREHLTSDVRVHYCIDNGGTAMNIIPDFAEASYGVRANTVEAALDVKRRVLNVAQGAALMTETTLEVEDLSGCYDTLNNGVLGELMDECLRQVEFEPWTEEELELAGKLNATNPRVYQGMCARNGIEPGTQLFTGVAAPNFAREMASTDAGDVMHIAPGINFGTACAPICAMPHTWQATAAYGGEIGIKGMIYGAKAMALCALRLMESPETVAAAKAEFQKTTGGAPYVCLMSENDRKNLLTQIAGMSEVKE